MRFDLDLLVAMEQLSEGIVCHRHQPPNLWLEPDKVVGWPRLTPTRCQPERQYSGSGVMNVVEFARRTLRMHALD